MGVGCRVACVLEVGYYITKANIKEHVLQARQLLQPLTL